MHLVLSPEQVLHELVQLNVTVNYCEMESKVLPPKKEYVSNLKLSVVIRAVGF